MAILMAVAILTLLVVCGNVANLLLARSFSRQRETAIRMAMGAPRLRILRMLLAEGLVLSLAATAAAWFSAMWVTRAVVALLPPLESGARFDVDLTPDWRVGVYSLLLAAVCTVAFSAAPALRTCRQELLPSLKQGEHGIVSGRSATASILMVAQLALSVLLLLGGGLAWRSLSLIDATDLGFPRDHLLLAAVGTAGATSERLQGTLLLVRVRERLSHVPGVESVSWAVAAPPHSHPWMGIPAATASGASVPTDGTFVGPDYLRALGVPVLEGRAPLPADLGGSNIPAVVNQKMAQALWPGQSAVGQTFRLKREGPSLEVFGVVPNGAFNGVGEDGSFSGLAKSERRPFIFLPDLPSAGTPPERTFHIRYRGLLAPLVPAVRAAIHQTDARLTVFAVRSMQTEWEEFTSPIRVLVTLVGCFAVGGLLVASIGLYAVVAFQTGKRTRELGIRIALGASPAQAARLIIKEGLRLTALGLAIGLGICGIAGRALAHLLFGVTPTDAPTWLAVVALLTAVSLGACYAPAHRAARVDPMLALRQD
jgi:predicted permease